MVLAATSPSGAGTSVSKSGNSSPPVSTSVSISGVSTSVSTPVSAEVVTSVLFVSTIPGISSVWLVAYLSIENWPIPAADPKDPANNIIFFLDLLKRFRTSWYSSVPLVFIFFFTASFFSARSSCLSFHSSGLCNLFGFRFFSRCSFISSRVAVNSWLSGVWSSFFAFFKRLLTLFSNFWYNLA